MSELDSMNEKSHQSFSCGDNEVDEIQVSSKPGTTILVLVAIYWLAWIITVVSDILLRVRKQRWIGMLSMMSNV